MRYSKYKNVKTVVDGITFDSRREANRYCELKILLRAGEISTLRLQVPFVLFDKDECGRVIKYIADFVYTSNDGKQVVEDAKGYKTDVYKLKKRCMYKRYGIMIKEV